MGEVREGNTGAGGGDIESWYTRVRDGIWGKFHLT